MCHRFRLPDDLPPSFRGAAVRYLYLIQALTHRTPGAVHHPLGSSRHTNVDDATPPRTPNQPIDGTVFNMGLPLPDSQAEEATAAVRSAGGMEEAARLLGTSASQLSTVKASLHIWPPAVRQLPSLPQASLPVL